MGFGDVVVDRGGGGCVVGDGEGSDEGDDEVLFWDCDIGSGWYGE